MVYNIYVSSTNGRSVGVWALMPVKWDSADVETRLAELEGLIHKQNSEQGASKYSDVS